MTTLLEQAFSEAARLPEPDQEALAEWILAEINTERAWDAVLGRSAKQLEQIAEEALADFRRGATLPLDPESL